MNPDRTPLPVDAEARRRAARRTAVIVGLIAVAIYAAFILSGVLNS